MPTELELIALKTEFDLYLAFVKRLVLDLPNSEDRTRAALWLKKLRSITKDDQLKLRNEHLKLFLFALHRRALGGPFESKPPKDELECFHDGLTLLEMTRELIEITERKKSEGKKDGEEGFGASPLPPVRTNFSYDLKEYAACQQIPKFGYHVYYAVSSEPIQLWSKASGQTYPDSKAVPNQFEWELSMAKLCDGVLEQQAELDAKLDAQRQLEQGFVFEDKEEEEVKQPEMDIKPCGGTAIGGNADAFKWKAGSKLLIYQSYDFSDVGVADDLIGQGKHQLEMDEDALNVLDESLPGRQRVHIRVPYYEGLPPDFLERRHHGVYEEIPDEEECEGPPCGEEEDECDIGDEQGAMGSADMCPCGNYEGQQDYGYPSGQYGGYGQSNSMQMCGGNEMEMQQQSMGNQWPQQGGPGWGNAPPYASQGDRGGSCSQWMSQMPPQCQQMVQSQFGYGSQQQARKSSNKAGTQSSRDRSNSHGNCTC